MSYLFLFKIMRAYIQNGCLLVATAMYFLSLILQMIWPLGTWPLWLRIVWFVTFCSCAITGTWLTCDWWLPKRLRAADEKVLLRGKL